jgi:hypothetical protein
MLFNPIIDAYTEEKDYKIAQNKMRHSECGQAI